MIEDYGPGNHAADGRPETKELFANLKKDLPALEELLAQCNEHWIYGVLQSLPYSHGYPARFMNHDQRRNRLSGLREEMGTSSRRHFTSTSQHVGNRVIPTAASSLCRTHKGPTDHERAGTGHLRNLRPPDCGGNRHEL